MIKFIIKIPKNVLVFLIKTYQFALSPDHSKFFKDKYPYGYCRFYPSCSQYTKEAIKRHGAIKGFLLGLKRTIKCNPWVEPKIDKVI